MRIHAIIHVPYEGLGCIADWVDKGLHSLTFTRIYESVVFPSVSDVDLLVVMGGPMSVYDEPAFPWLKEEKAFISAMIGQGKKVLGICLGSQLIAEVLGTKVYPNHQKEIGWMNVRKTTVGCRSGFPGDDEFTVFHWHGDTYDLPSGALHLFESEACLHQAFMLYDRVIALQFHLEVTCQTLNGMVENGKDEIERYQCGTVQPVDDILSVSETVILKNNRIMFEILDGFSSVI